MIRPLFHSLTLALLILAAMTLALPAVASDIPKDVLSQRDPFKMPLIPKAQTPQSELQLFPADQFKLVGILAGGPQMRAMIAAPNGKTYFVHEKMPIGMKHGYIRKITDSALFIREKTINVLGDPENVDTVLKLPSDKTHDVKSITSQQGW